MLDVGQKWSPAGFDPELSLPGLSVRKVPGLHLALVSGNTSACLARLGIAGPPLGATALAEGDGFALAMARDRCLAVSATPFALEEGWHAEGYAFTEVTDGFTPLSVTGSALMPLLAHATTNDWDTPTRSAAISFAGLAAAAVFRGDKGGLWLFVETPQLPYLQRWLSALPLLSP